MFDCCVTKLKTFPTMGSAARQLEGAGRDTSGICEFYDVRRGETDFGVSVPTCILSIIHGQTSPYTSQPGSYLFRLSCTRLGQWAIGYVTENGDILQTIPQNKSLMKVLIDGDTNRFYTRPKGQETNPDLSQYVHETNPQAVEINEEEYQIYCDMGSTFQLCKVIF